MLRLEFNLCLRIFHQIESTKYKFDRKFAFLPWSVPQVRDVFFFANARIIIFSLIIKKLTLAENIVFGRFGHYCCLLQQDKNANVQRRPYSHVCVKSERVDEFHSHLNSINLHIKFTIEVKSEGSIAFLDTKTTRQEDGSITVSVYRKATNADRYLDFKSHHHPQHKHSVPRTLMDRARNIPSTEEEVSRETKRVAKALVTNNYPANFVHNLHQPSRQQQTNDIDHRGFVILPYAKGFSERVANVRRGFNIKVAHKPIRTISNILKQPKDRIEKEDTRGIVHKIDYPYSGKMHFQFQPYSLFKMRIIYNRPTFSSETLKIYWSLYTNTSTSCCSI